MSAIIEKTISSLPALLSAAVTGRPELLYDSQSTSAFKQFMRKCKSLSTKQEETQFLLKEIETLKDQLSEPNVKSKRKRELLLCLLYCHLLGYDVTFAHIHAVKLAQQGSLLEKRSGYLMCSLFLHEKSDLAMLLVNTILKDLRSRKLLEVCIALTCVPQLANRDMVPALLPAVVEKIQHNREMVRRKCVLCLAHFYSLCPDLHPHSAALERALADSHPSVVWAAVTFYVRHTQEQASSRRHLTPVFVNILNQVLDQRLPADYTFQGVSAPWLQIYLLRILAHLGIGDSEASDQMYSVLNTVLSKTEASTKTGLAVLYECLLTVCTVHPDPDLLSRAVPCISRFLGATNLTLKYLGVKALCELVRISPRFAAEHQTRIMECLEHSDPTLQNQAYELLYSMANPRNLGVVSGKLLQRLRATQDGFMRRGLTERLLQLCQRFQGDLSWYLTTSNQVLSTAAPGDLPADVANRLLTAVFTADPAGQGGAVKIYWGLLKDRGSLCPPLLTVAVMVVCEFWRLLGDGVTPSNIVECVLSRLHPGHVTSGLPQTRDSAIPNSTVGPLTHPSHTNTTGHPTFPIQTNSIPPTSFSRTNLTSHPNFPCERKISGPSVAVSTGPCLALGLRRLLPYVSAAERERHMGELRERLQGGGSSDRQVLRELEGICRNAEFFKSLLEKKDGKKQPDWTLTSLDGYVVQQLDKGAFVYKPPSLRKAAPGRKSKAETSSLKLENHVCSASPAASLQTSTSSLSESKSVELVVKKNVWSSDGYQAEEALATDQVAVTTDSAATQSESLSELRNALFQGLDDPSTDLHHRSSTSLLQHSSTSLVQRPSTSLHQHLSTSLDLREVDLPPREGVAWQGHIMTSCKQNSQCVNAVDSRRARGLESYASLNLEADETLGLEPCSDIGGNLDSRNFDSHYGSASGFECERKDSLLYLDRASSRGTPTEQLTHRYRDLDDYFETDSLEGSPSKTGATAAE